MDDQLLAAAQAGDVSKLRELKAKGANIESKDTVRVAGVQCCACRRLVSGSLA